MKNEYYDAVDDSVDNCIVKASKVISSTLSILFRLKVIWISYTNNYLDDKIINFKNNYVKSIDANPYLLVSKTEFLEIKKSEFYDKANSIIEFVNNIRNALIVKKFNKKIDVLFNKVIFQK